MSDIYSHPAYRDLHDVVPLSGFSGAYVALVKSHHTAPRCVRKAAVSESGNDRLRDQAHLQSALTEILSGAAQVPKVFEEGLLAGCYWYDMEFVPGLDAVEYLSTATRTKAENFTGQIGRILDALAAVTLPEAPPIDLSREVCGKLDQIDQGTKGAFVALTNGLRETLGAEQVLLSPNAVHGDLTLENILVDRNERLWLIDTIPSPFTHYWIDLAKLYQDLTGRWFMHRGRSLSIGLLRAVSEEIMQHALALDAHYARYHPCLLGLTFARILPYCKTAEDTRFVTNRIELALKMAAVTQEPHL